MFGRCGGDGLFRQPTFEEYFTEVGFPFSKPARVIGVIAKRVIGTDSFSARLPVDEDGTGLYPTEVDTTIKRNGSLIGSILEVAGNAERNVASERSIALSLLDTSFDYVSIYQVTNEAVSDLILSRTGVNAPTERGLFDGGKL
jgi:hypothetical protein